jgi:hypothetical protein
LGPRVRGQISVGPLDMPEQGVEFTLAVVAQGGGDAQLGGQSAQEKP